MEKRSRVVFSIFFATFLHISYGCQMEGVTIWQVPVSVTILDTFSGTVLSRSTSNIEDITNIRYGESTLGGPYFQLSLVDSQFVIQTNAAFENYEENEVSPLVSITVEFRCSGATTSASLTFLINISDTNNNYPRFIPTDDFEFVVTPPLPPGYLITGCFNDITVRDIDLTTQRIEFTIEDNPYFNIEYDASASTEAKEFRAILRTTTFIRSLAEPIALTITATDVDLTDDPPLSTNATLRIVGDSEFQFPEEPIFAQAFYLANYTEAHQLNLFETISLQQGFDGYVNFTLEGEYADNFLLTSDGYEVFLEVETSLPMDVWSQRQIYLVVRAVREFTSGDTTTVVVQFPEEVTLQFVSAIYEGAIINNELQISQLVLSQGYDNNNLINADIVGDYSSYFSASVQGNLITLSMLPLIDEIIEDNSFISFQVLASSVLSEASTVVSLEIIKDDNVTPVFDKLIYTATYDPNTGLDAEPISFVQGFDNTVNVWLDGEYESLFQFNQSGLTVTLTSSTIPPELYSLQNILISIQASKPRTVGANGVINIALPAAREIEFEESIYRGTIEDNEVTLETIRLSNGYEEGVTFHLSGELSTYFNATNTLGEVVISLSSLLSDAVITQNNVIVLTLTASGTNVITTSTSILLDIIKEDATTPIFSQNIYYGTYSGMALEIEAINLQQGNDAGVTLRLDGAHAQYFAINANAEIVLQNQIPEEVIFNEKVLLFNVIADKAFTVGANAAVLITFPTELTEATVMRFSQNAYIGYIEENDISLENIIILETGFATGTEYHLTGDYAEHFNLTTTDDTVQISSLRTLPNEVLRDNDFLLLEIEARRQRAVSAWTSVVVDIVKPYITAPVFNQAYYTGVYTEEIGLMFEETINLEEGYDETVTFALVGEWSPLFRLEPNITSNEILIELKEPIPIGVIENNNYLMVTLVAENSKNLTGLAVVFIDLLKEQKEVPTVLAFDRVNYVGAIENGQSTIPAITLSVGYTQGVSFTLHGELADYFGWTSDGAVVSITLQNDIPEQLIPANRIVLLTIQATAPGAIPALATIVLKHVENYDTPLMVELIFAQTFYSGSYSAATGLSFPTPLSLTQGYDPSVVFALEGDEAQWFRLERNENSVSLVVTSGIPAGVLANNQQLVFVVTAQKPGSATARATVVISITDEHTEDSAILAFDRVNYVGAIENGQSTIPAITLSVGYTQEVSLTLHGELADYFGWTSDGAVVSITLQNDIPVQLIPANRIVLLTIQATAPGAIPALATIVLKHVENDDTPLMVELIFAQTFYSGSYSAATGLSFPTPLSLTQGYDPSVVFALEGDEAQWFRLERNENSVSLVVTSGIPAGVLANNQQLVFVVTAQKPGSATARATVVISITDEHTEDSAILAFDRVNYVGAIENGQSTIPAITLSVGYTQGVSFTLHGELADYFGWTSDGAVVSITLQNDIPEQLIPANRIVLLTIQATAPGAIPALATIVLKHVENDDTPLMVELIFVQTFYSGSYSAATGLSFPTPLSLTQGYDPSVVFALEGDEAQWFRLERNENSVSLVVTSGIPAGVLANNQQLVFVVTAQKPGSATARATVVISITDEHTEDSAILAFDRVNYVGAIENGQSTIPAITLSVGYTQGVSFTLHGELADYFGWTSDGAVVSITLQNDIPEQLIPANRIVLLTIQATAPGAIPALATIVLKHVENDDTPLMVELIFAQTFYSGSYSAATGLSFPTPLSLTQGYDPSVVFALEGDEAQWFRLQRNENSVSLVVTSGIPAGVLANNQQLVFVVTAQKPGSATARATVVISITDEHTEDSAILAFDRVNYVGAIENGQSTIPAITLSVGYTQGVSFTLHGELADYFGWTSDGAVVSITLQNDIPEQLIPANRIVLLTIQATAPGAIPALATIVLKHVENDDTPLMVELIFAQTFYSGSYSAATGLSFPTPLSLTQGYDPSVVFALEGDEAQWFRLERNENSVSLVVTSGIPAGVLANNQQLVFVVTAQKPGSATARATVVISITDEHTEDSAILAFDRVNYVGAIENGQSTIPAITLSVGYTQGVSFTLHGELADYFGWTSDGAVVSITLQNDIPEQLIPANRIVLLTIQATAPGAIPVFATIVLKHVENDDTPLMVELIFAQTFYSGSYSAATGLSFPTPLSLTQGYDPSVMFALEGDDAQWFRLERNENSVSLVVTSGIPPGVLANNWQLVFVVTAQKPGSATARATVVISITDDSQAGSDVTFEKVLFEGIVQNGVVSHETIIITGFPGSNVELNGEYSSLFEPVLSNNEVRVQASGSLTLPADVTHVLLELRAGTAAAVLVLNVIHIDVPIAPTVSFSSSSYAVRVDITQTGLVGQVHASSDNGEAVLYSLLLDNAHLEERLSVNSEGELHLSAPVNAGIFTFQVIATTAFTQTSGNAAVHLSVEAITVCGDDYVVAPLIVLDVDEEEPHYDLINGTHENCHFTLTNRWPLEQTWLYIDEEGLHTTAIDREHESIAFMPVSQIQVELILHCDGDASRTKRSLTSDALGPYDYGNNKWILTDTILYNSRRSLVNVIVNDINDNAPIFVGKESEPIAVGYPIPDLAERVLPRSLAELQATDADIGENAALLYWSSEPELAVAPTTGFVHLRDGAALTNGALLTVHATDRYGQGLTGSIDLLVRLLDEGNIAVVTVRDSFLDDEETVLAHLSESIGYELKLLRSVVISNGETSEESSRKRRDVSSDAGASLQLYVYGLIDREPVAVDRLTADISNTALTAVIVASTVSLQDHLEAQEICVIAGRDTGLLVATIVLSVLLFIVLVLIGVWFFLRWRRKKNYDQFSDENSLASRGESVDKFPRPEALPKPRLDIGELKKSERRLQEMLDAPVQVITQPTSSRNDAILDLLTPEPLAPIVIQSIDKLKDADDESSDDEFGERKIRRRKSVVTFNENVEKIIHVENNEPEDISTDMDYEIYKL